ncbi:complexin-2 [Blautia glucerasea]|uniref:complexin-2 n=1 Tax=Blautia glucerasea TaxID=536633 RepID=UPI001D008900|nr:complexin-2 [Blautia glucerasea]MCB5386645.1 complexin-2 [Blautia glucerasea]MCB5421000.1 complexin-2 [Blautia luti]
MKNVQIPQELFMKLLRYHLLDDDSCAEKIKKGLEQKMNAMVDRELYTRSKTAPTEEEREKARQEYLDRRGIPEDFRW